MKSESITAGRQVKVAAGFIHGVNSLRNPWALPEDQFKWGQNVTIRGGVVQTRPGFKMKLSLPAGNFQGGVLFNANKQARASETIVTSDGQQLFRPATIYKPDGEESLESEISYLVFCVDGKVYWAPFPLTQPKDWAEHQLTGIHLDPTVKTVNFAVATQSASISTGGGVTVTPSHRVVIVQDGVSTPGYWDGSDLTGHESKNIPIGFWMAYSGSRLWVATGNIIQASDLANPLGWNERLSGTGRGDFSVPRPVTALHDYVGQNNDSRLYVFTDRATYSLASGILDRTSWANTQNFQSTLYPAIGCVAGKSITFQAGMMFWYAQGGLVSADVAAASYLSSQTLFKDVEMVRAKRYMSGDVSGIAAVSFENYLLCSIPYLEKGNSATMVLDYAPASEWNQGRSPAWAGVWTGIRPVEWASGVVDRESKLFAFSVDYAATNDGSFNHVWEVFSPERYDSYLHFNADGTTTDYVSRIYCQMETALLGDSMDLKQLAYGEVDACELSGTVDVRISYRGTKGGYRNILEARALALTEPYQYETSYDVDKVKKLGFLQTQTRRFVTQTVDPFTPMSCESAYMFNVSKAFSLLIEWCGAMGVEAARLFLDPYAEKSVGQTNFTESKYCAVGETGDSILVDVPNPAVEAQPSGKTWTATVTKTASRTCPGGAVSTASASASYISHISQEDANMQAGNLAQAKANYAIAEYAKANPCP